MVRGVSGVPEIAGTMGERRIRRFAALPGVRATYLASGGSPSFIDSPSAPWLRLSDYAQVLDVVLDEVGAETLRRHARELMREEIERGRFSPLASVLSGRGRPVDVIGTVAPLMWQGSMRNAGRLEVSGGDRVIDLQIHDPPSELYNSDGWRTMLAGSVLAVVDALGRTANLRFVEKGDVVHIELRWVRQTEVMVGRPSTPPKAIFVGERHGPGDALLGRYQLISRLGAGSYGEVWSATDHKMQRKVALKILRKLGLEELGRLEREARILAKLQAPNIVTIYEIERLDGTRPFLVLELLSGHTLRTILARTGRLDFGRVCAIAKGLLRGLGAAHRAGVVHRDVKPANVIVSKLANERLVKVIDFGLAGFVDAKTAESLGSLPYAAPEQLRGSEPSARADVYSAGATLYELLLGHPPFRPSHYESVEAFVRDVERARPPLIDVLPEPAMRLLRRALAKDPAARFESCEEMALECNAALTPVLDAS